MPEHPASTTTTFLDQPPSCLQFCPASPNYFIIGTYLLSETKSTESDGSETIQQSKTGSLQLWHLDPETDNLYCPINTIKGSNKHRTQISRYALEAAVFDLQFHPAPRDQGKNTETETDREQNIFAVAASDAFVSLFTVSPETGFTCLWRKFVHEDPSIPALFLAWVPENWLPGSRDGFAVTFSDGKTGVFGLEEGESASGDGADGEQGAELGVFEAKQLIEVWFVAMASYPVVIEGSEDSYPEKGGKVYAPYMFTGNDFGSVHTRRFANINGGCGDGDQVEGEEEDGLSPLLINTDDRAAHHTAGVTSILPLPIPLSHALAHGEPLLLTGSYDEGLRVYHACRGGRGRVIAEAGLGGGVWRLQLLETSTLPGQGNQKRWSFLVLASCMHGGTRVVRVSMWTREDGDAEADIEVLSEFREHESMNYASDVWRPAPGSGGSGSKLRVVSSSFYDRRVCVWRAKR